jgi:hypothetical protein
LPHHPEHGDGLRVFGAARIALLPAIDRTLQHGFHLVARLDVEADAFDFLQYLVGGVRELCESSKREQEGQGKGFHGAS